MFARIFFMFALLAGPAAAHPGHLADVAGHDHWVAGAAIAIALGLGIREIIKGKKSKDDSEDIDDETEEELQEA